MLQLSPVLGLISGAVFVVKAAILSGAFYVHAAALFLCGVVMAARTSSSLTTMFSSLIFMAISFRSIMAFRTSLRTREWIAMSPAAVTRARSSTYARAWLSTKVALK